MPCGKGALITNIEGLSGNRKALFLLRPAKMLTDAQTCARLCMEALP